MICPSDQICRVTQSQSQDIGVCDCTVANTYGNQCELTSVIPQTPLVGQSGWGQNSTTSNLDPTNPTLILEETITPANLDYVYQGKGSWFVSNRFANGSDLGIYIFSPPFLKTVGESTIQTFLNPPQFYGGDTMEYQFYFRAVSSVADGTRMGVSAGSNLFPSVLNRIYVDSKFGNSLNLTVIYGFNQTFEWLMLTPMTEWVCIGQVLH